MICHIIYFLVLTLKKKENPFLEHWSKFAGIIPNHQILDFDIVDLGLRSDDGSTNNTWKYVVGEIWTSISTLK